MAMMVNASVYYQIPQWSRPPRSYLTNGLVNTLMTGISFMSNEMILYCACRSKFFNEEKELQGRIISVSLQYIIASVFLLGPTLWYIVVAKSYSHVHTTSCIFIKNLNIMITLSFAATTMVLAINRYCTLKFNQSPKISKMCLAFVAANLPFVGALIFMSFFVNEWVRNEVCDYISHNTYVSVGEYGLALTYIGVSILFNVLTLEQFKKKQGAGLGVAEPDTGMLERQENTKQIMARNTLIFSLYPMIFLAPTYFYNMGAYAFKEKPTYSTVVSLILEGIFYLQGSIFIKINLIYPMASARYWLHRTIASFINCSPEPNAVPPVSRWVA